MTEGRLTRSTMSERKYSRARSVFEALAASLGEEAANTRRASMMNNSYFKQRQFNSSHHTHGQLSAHLQRHNDEGQGRRKARRHSTGSSKVSTEGSRKVEREPHHRRRQSSVQAAASSVPPTYVKGSPRVSPRVSPRGSPKGSPRGSPKGVVEPPQQQQLPQKPPSQKAPSRTTPLQKPLSQAPRQAAQHVPRQLPPQTSSQASQSKESTSKDIQNRIPNKIELNSNGRKTPDSDVTGSIVSGPISKSLVEPQNLDSKDVQVKPRSAKSLGKKQKNEGREEARTDTKSKEKSKEGPAKRSDSKRQKKSSKDGEKNESKSRKKDSDSGEIKRSSSAKRSKKKSKSPRKPKSKASITDESFLDQLAKALPVQSGKSESDAAESLEERIMCKLQNYIVSDNCDITSDGTPSDILEKKGDKHDLEDMYDAVWKKVELLKKDEAL